MNPKKMQYRSGKYTNQKKQLKKEQILTLCAVGIVLIIMIAISVHNYNVKNYNYIKQDKKETLIYTQYYNENGDYTKEIPYVNMNGSQIVEVNNEINALMQKYKELSRAIVTYETELNGQVLSLVIKAVNYETNYAAEVEFKSFNININTQAVYDDTAILELYGISSNYVKDRIRQQLQSYYTDLVNDKYYTKQECNFECFLNWRGIDDYLDDISYYISGGKLYAYRPFTFASVFGEEEYFTDEDFMFLIIEEPTTQ